MLSARDEDGGILAAVSGSIQPGNAPNIGISPGVLSEGIAAMADQGEESSGDQVASVSGTLPEAEQDHTGKDNPAERGGFGTGFLVSANGDLLTNSHVISGCASLSVDGVTAIVVANDEAFDLALLRLSTVPDAAPAVFASRPARLNSDVTVVGYPLPEILGGLNVTRGSVTSLKGVGGDGVQMQISAPVQPGNSGGPVLNAAGQIVGVVVAKLDAQRVAEVTGDIPQNVNFAIRGEIATLFLYQNGVEPVEADEASSIALAPEDIAEVAKGYTRLVTCE